MAGYIPPWMNSEVDEFGNPLPKPIPPYQPEQPGVPGVLAEPEQVPPWAQAEGEGHPAAQQAPAPFQRDPSQAGVLSLPIGEVAGESPPPQRPPWMQSLVDIGKSKPVNQEPASLEVDAISGGEVPSQDQSRPYVSGISREPSLAERENQNIMQMGGIQEAKSQQKAGIMGDAVSEQEMLDFAHAKRDADRQRAIAAKMEQFEADTEAYANGRVDPQRWQDRQGFAGTVLYGITAFLVGMANPRGPNQVVQWIGQQIERDLEAQRADLQRAGQALTFKGNALSREIEMAGDLKAGEDAFRAKRWALAGQKIATVDQSFASEEQRVATQQALVEAEKQRRILAAELELKVAKLTIEEQDRMAEREQKYAELMQREADSRRDFSLGKYGIDVGSADKALDRQTDLEKARLAQRDKDIELARENGVASPATAKNIGRFTIGKSEEWTKARDAGQAYHRGRALYEEYITLMEKGAKHALNDAERSRARSLHADLVTNWKHSKQMGAWDAGLALLGNKAVPDPVEIGGGGKEKGWFDLPGDAMRAWLADKVPALRDNSRRLGEEIDAKYNSLGYESLDGRPFSESYITGKPNATEGEGPAARASKIVPVEDGKKKPKDTVPPLESPRIGR